MKYKAIITTTNEHDTRTITANINAPSAMDAHTIAAAMPVPSGDRVINVYPDTNDVDGVVYGALFVARRTAANAIIRGGNDTQRRIDAEFRAINARCVGGDASRVMRVIRDYSHDTQDMFDAACLGVCDAHIRNAGNIIEQYHAAFLEMNCYVKSTKTAANNELSIEYIVSGGGEIVSISTAISTIIYGGDSWTPAACGEMDVEAAARLGNVLHNAMDNCAGRQREIAEMLAIGYGNADIARKLGINPTTVLRHIAMMRRTVYQYINDTAPEFLTLIHTYDVDSAAAAANANNRRTDEGKAREKANCKARHSAEYYREYRARKAAARKAAETNK